MTFTGGLADQFETHYTGVLCNGKMMLGGWGRSPGSSGSVPPSGQRTGHRLLPLPFNRTGGGSGSGGSGGRAAEAEDVMGHYGRNKQGNVNKIRTGLYYSPPGTSYTILEKPPVSSSPPPPPPPRATYLRESSAGMSGPNHLGEYRRNTRRIIRRNTARAAERENKLRALAARVLRVHSHSLA